MELLSPAGNFQKLSVAYAYGADAAYIELKNFSLRAKADNFSEDESEKVRALKKKFPGKKLHCAINVLFHEGDIARFKESIPIFKRFPIDAFIVQDMGIVPLLQKEFPGCALHLSTQASCVNSEAAKFYARSGFSRIVLGREASLKEIRAIKDAAPEVELEAFCHGAMCVAYSGRCLMSAYLAGRSAQSGFCAHACRWDWKTAAESGALALEEAKRPGERLPVLEGDGFTALFSSKDLNMISHLADMKAAGIDAIKIEGRMKSALYVALVTQAYRKALDALDGKISREEAEPFAAELENVPHRKSNAGFYYNRADADETAEGESCGPYVFAALVGDEISSIKQEELFALGLKTEDDFKREMDSLRPEARAARERAMAFHGEKSPRAAERKRGWMMYELSPMNKTFASQGIEIISPGERAAAVESGRWKIIDKKDGTERGWFFDGHPCALYIDRAIPPVSLVRAKRDAEETV